VKISTQALMLQMAAADLFGQSNYQKFDELTVSLAHPDAFLALMNNTAGVNAHFGTSPFYEQEMKIPGARLLTTSYDILGGRASALVVIATSKFHDANPKVYKAFLAAQREAIETINKDRKAAAKAYLEIAKDTRNSVDDIFAVINDKDYAFTLSPEKVFKTAVFMGKVGTVKGPAGEVAGPVLPRYPLAARRLVLLTQSMRSTGPKRDSAPHHFATYRPRSGMGSGFRTGSCASNCPPCASAAARAFRATGSSPR
jgi:hypothetical protein